MVAVLQRLGIQALIKKKNDEDGFVWTWDEWLKDQPVEFFKPMIANHSMLTLEYSVLRTSLICGTQISDEAFVEQLVTALVMAELLTHINRDYLVAPGEVRRL